jgi:hypothetical protein
VEEWCNDHSAARRTTRSDDDCVGSSASNKTDIC